MREILEYKLRMYYSVIAICENRSELGCENQVFAESFAKFRSKIPQIKQCADILKMETLINESFKTIDRIELEEVSFYLIGKVIRFAQHTNNENLYSELNYERINISHCADVDLIGLCNNLSKIASDHIAEIADFGVSVDDIIELQQLTAAFSTNLNRIRSAHIKTKTTEEKLKKHFRDCDELLKNRLDKDIEFFKNSDPNFYSDYQSSRVVVGDEANMVSENGIANAIN